MAGIVNNTRNKVKAISPLAQWKVDNLRFDNYRRSGTFKIGIWNWCLTVWNNYSVLSIRLIYEPNFITEDKHPFAQIVIHANCTGSTNDHYRSTVYKHFSLTEKKVIWHIEFVSASSVTMLVEFVDLKISTSNDASQSSIRPDDSLLLDRLRTISRMFQESMYTDITIQTLDGSLRAHKAVLASSSPVFKCMFLHDLKEKQSSIIKIEDMSTDVCSALLAYMYGTIKQQDLEKHCFPLLAAADKYYLQDLRKCCEKMLLEDINSSNVFERLQAAWLYKLDRLKEDCFKYLSDFNKLHDMKEQLHDFYFHADRELLLEVFKKTISAKKP
ncbi:BTB/POZ domain-containing protein At1g21780-like [Zingiber officinale]|nr:BTB/POZ domain-containing protein At1g21780-like [Zingiber officinale]